MVKSESAKTTYSTEVSSLDVAARFLVERARLRRDRDDDKPLCLEFFRTIPSPGVRPS
jgi:hypothetical protein